MADEAGEERQVDAVDVGPGAATGDLESPVIPQAALDLALALPIDQLRQRLGRDMAAQNQALAQSQRALLALATTRSQEAMSRAHASLGEQAARQAAELSRAQAEIVGQAARRVSEMSSVPSAIGQQAARLALEGRRLQGAIVGDAARRASEFVRQQEVLRQNLLLAAVGSMRQEIVVDQSARMQRISGAAIAATSRQSWQQQMQLVLPLLETRFNPQVLGVIAETLDSIEGIDQVEDIAPDGDVSAETIQEIEEALSSFNPECVDLPPELARSLWIWWVRSFVFAVCLYAVVILPGGAELAGMLGSGALPAAMAAGREAAKAWDRRYGSDGDEEPADA